MSLSICVGLCVYIWAILDYFGKIVKILKNIFSKENFFCISTFVSHLEDMFKNREYKDWPSW